MGELLQFLPEAKAEVGEITAYYENQVLGLGVRFKHELSSVILAIALNPLIRRERSGGYRRVNMPGFPYYVSYIIVGEMILIIAVAHASRHPDYWKKRIR